MDEQADNERAEREVAEQPGEEQHLTVVGIGASAGGLAALQGFFDALPADNGMAFVVVTHMDPERESLLPEILQKHTAMPVQQVTELVLIEAEHVYVISPNRRIFITDTHLETQAFDEPRGRRTPVDDFFRSLADVHRQAVAVILSGGGTDGAVGVKAVKEEGGLLMVQDPDEAEHDSMPRAAITTGLADVVLPVQELAQKLVEYHTNGVHVPTEPEALTADELETLYRILTQVQAHTGHDFSQYKRSTLLRRIQRRLQLNGQRTLDAYLGNLRHDPAEARALFNDLLIGVTNFFRDQEAWEALAEQVIPRLFEGKAPHGERGDTVRVWSIGCATGEEAYSLAILLLEHAATLERPLAGRPGLQVFASDLDDSALQKAREGIYPQAIEADVSVERLQRWFVKEGSYYRVKQELRDIVLFSSHSVLRDPPFSRLDLVSCRNLLIYLNRDLQENVFRIFHYALRPGAYLFLGSAESAEMAHALFHTLDKHHRLYRARPQRGEHPLIPSLPLSMPRGERHHTAAGEPAPSAASRPAGPVGELHEALLEAAAPPSVLVDEHHEVLHISDTAGRYLRHPAGVPTSDLLKLVRPELQFELRSVLFQAFEHQQPALSQPVLVQFNGRASAVIMAVRPQRGERDSGGSGNEPLALVFFLEDVPVAEAPPAAAADAPAVEAVAAEEGEAERAEGATQDGRHTQILAQLEAENRRLRERLQATAEEYESSHEELKAANEELQSINEEYRSTTEELETSKEELQSVNEELQTVNAELKNKLAEVSQAHGDLENLMVATNIATLFLDRELRIQRYTASTAELFNVMPGDRGRPITHLTNKLQYERLGQDAAQVLKSLVPVEREIQDNGGRWFLAQLRPYRTPDHRIDGVVLTFVDINKLKEAEAALRASEERYRALVTSTSDVIYSMSPDWQEMKRLAGRGFLADTDAPNAGWLEEYIPQEARERVLATIEEAIRTKSVFELEHRVWQADGSVGWTSSRAVPLLDEQGRIKAWIGAAKDVTDRKQAEAALRAGEERLRKILQIGTVGVVFFDKSGTIVDANDTFLEQVGYTRRELEAGALSWQKLTPPEWMEESRQQLAQMAETGLIGPYEKQYYRQDGSRWWFLFAGAQLEDGTLVEFCVDIGDLKETEAALRVEKEYSEKIVDTVREGLLVLEPDLTVEFANESFYEMFEVVEQETIGTLVYDLGNGQWNIPELRALLEEILPATKVFNGYRVEHEFEDVGRRVMLLNARRLDHVQRILLAIEDITEQERYEEQLRALNETLEERVARRTAQVEKLAGELTMAEHEERGRIAQILHDDLQQQLYALQMQLTFLQEGAAGEAMQQEIAEMDAGLETAIRTARQLSVDLSPPVLEGEGLAEAIGWLATLMEERHQLRVTVQADDSFTVPDLDRRVLLFQAVRELLFNVVKHARTPEATVRLQRAGDPDQEPVYRIDVVDEGIGFDPQAVLGPEARPNGRGLRHTRQRLEMIGGRLEVASIPDDGTRVTILVPPQGEDA